MVLPSRLVSLAVLACCSLPVVFSNLETHRYSANERVELFVNKVGPYANPHETYAYYDLPFCHPEDGHKTNAVSVCVFEDDTKGRT